MKLLGYVSIPLESNRVPNFLVTDPGSVPVEGLTEYSRISSTPGVFLEEASIERVLILDELMQKGGK